MPNGLRLTLKRSQRASLPDFGLPDTGRSLSSQAGDRGSGMISLNLVGMHWPGGMAWAMRRHRYLGTA